MKRTTKFLGISAKNTQNYQGVSIPFIDGTTRLLLPERPFVWFRKWLQARGLA
jgi:hypothetical protein